MTRHPSRHYETWQKWCKHWNKPHPTYQSMKSEHEGADSSNTNQEAVYQSPLNLIKHLGSHSTFNSAQIVFSYKCKQQKMNFYKASSPKFLVYWTVWTWRNANLKGFYFFLLCLLPNIFWKLPLHIAPISLSDIKRTLFTGYCVSFF